MSWIHSSWYLPLQVRLWMLNEWVPQGTTWVEKVCIVLLLEWRYAQSMHPWNAYRKGKLSRKLEEVNSAKTEISILLCLLIIVSAKNGAQEQNSLCKDWMRLMAGPYLKFLISLYINEQAWGLEKFSQDHAVRRGTCLFPAVQPGLEQKNAQELPRRKPENFPEGCSQCYFLTNIWATSFLRRRLTS